MSEAILKALMVTQFQDNKYDRLVYDMNKTISQADYDPICRDPHGNDFTAFRTHFLLL